MWAVLLWSVPPQGWLRAEMYHGPLPLYKSPFFLSQVLIPNKYAFSSIQTVSASISRKPSPGQAPWWRAQVSPVGVFVLTYPTSCPSFLPHWGPAELQWPQAHHQPHSHNCVQSNSFNKILTQYHIVVLTPGYSVIRKRKIKLHKRQEIIWNWKLERPCLKTCNSRFI